MIGHIEHFTSCQTSCLFCVTVEQHKCLSLTWLWNLLAGRTHLARFRPEQASIHEELWLSYRCVSHSLNEGSDTMTKRVPLSDPHPGLYTNSLSNPLNKVSSQLRTEQNRSESLVLRPWLISLLLIEDHIGLWFDKRSAWSFEKSEKNESKKSYPVVWDEASETCLTSVILFGLR